MVNGHFALDSSPNHKFAYQKYLMYDQSKLTGPVTLQLSSQHREDVMRNRALLATNVRTVLLCAKQEISLRGHREHEEDGSTNPGNFLAILNLVRSNNVDATKTTEATPGNGKYTSPEIQNEIIDIGADIVRKMIVNEVNELGGFYAIIADECKDFAGHQQLSVCIRYASKSQIQERFLGFVRLEKFDAQHISFVLSNFVIGLDLKNCVAQCYDGANVMSGNISGVHTRIEEMIGGKCPYIHCHAHVLNLVLVACCSEMLQIRETLGLCDAVYKFQSNSVKRSLVFENAQKTLNYSILKIPQCCDTRWSSKLKGISYFESRLDAVVVALEKVVSEGSVEEASLCGGLATRMRSFSTAIMLVILERVLSTTNRLSEYLQGTQVVYTEAAHLCEATVRTLMEMRDPTKFGNIYKEAIALHKKTNPEHHEEASAKRRKTVSKNLQNSYILSTIGVRNFIDSSNSKDEYLRIYYEILDKFIAEMERRFDNKEEIGQGLSAADPSSENFLNEDDVISFCESFSRFGTDLKALRGQIPLAKNFLIQKGVKSVMDCVQVLANFKTIFPEVLSFL